IARIPGGHSNFYLLLSRALPAAREPLPIVIQILAIIITPLMRLSRFFVVGLIASFSARITFAQTTRVCSASGPCVFSVYNAAGYISQELPGGGIAQGSMMAITGSRLGPSGFVIARNFPLSISLEDTSVEVISGSFRQNALVYYASDQQVAAILPSSTPL